MSSQAEEQMHAAALSHLNLKSHKTDGSHISEKSEFVPVFVLQHL